MAIQTACQFLPANAHAVLPALARAGQSRTVIAKWPLAERSTPASVPGGNVQNPAPGQPSPALTRDTAHGFRADCRRRKTDLRRDAKRCDGRGLIQSRSHRARAPAATQAMGFAVGEAVRALPAARAAGKRLDQSLDRVKQTPRWLPLRSKTADSEKKSALTRVVSPLGGFDVASIPVYLLSAIVCHPIPY